MVAPLGHAVHTIGFRGVTLAGQTNLAVAGTPRMAGAKRQGSWTHINETQSG